MAEKKKITPKEPAADHAKSDDTPAARVTKRHTVKRHTVKRHTVKRHTVK